MFRVGRSFIKRCSCKQSSSPIQSYTGKHVRHLTRPPHSHLKPGYGSLEQVEIDFQPRCDDGTLPYNPIVQWYDWLNDATQRASRPIAYQHNTRQLLEAQGFVDIEESVIRLPLNSWPVDPSLKEIGRWYNLGMSEGLEAMSLGPLTRVYRWPPADVRRLVHEVKTQMCSKRIHAYNNM